MKLGSLEVTPNAANRGHSSVYLGGEEIKNAYSVTVRLRAGKFPRATIKLWLEDTSIRLGPMGVRRIKWLSPMVLARRLGTNGFCVGSIRHRLIRRIRKRNHAYIARKIQKYNQLRGLLESENI